MRPMISGFLVLSILAGGCGSFGPIALEKTQGRYNEAVHQVEQQELLYNLVRIKYNDTPTSLNLISIAAQYELAGQAEARPFFTAPNPSNSNVIFKTFTSILPDVLVSGANRPTLSLVPGDDSTATHQYLTPIPLETLIFLTRSGWPISSIMRLWVDRLNGVPNASTTSNPPRGLVPDYVRFQRIAELFQSVQDRELTAVVVVDGPTEVSGPLPAAAITPAAAVEAVKAGLEYRPAAGGQNWVLVRPGTRLVLKVNPGLEGDPQLLELESLLNLKPGLSRYDIQTTPDDVPDPLRVQSPPVGALQLMTRSTAQVYYYLANGVEAPCEDVAAGRVPAPVEGDRTFDTREVTRGLFEVHVCSSRKPPREAYVAVHYRNHWFYIDDRDQASKTTFGMVLQLSRLDFKRQPPGMNGPVLTLPAGR